MSELSWSVPVENDLRPAYYDDFCCLASKCRVSCCKGWCIPFDKKDYLALKRINGSPNLNNRLKNGVHRIRKGPMAEQYYGEFDMTTGSCPLLRDDSLCMLQIESGHESLPQVCQQFPRTQEYMPSGYLERSLSPACEGVLKLLWDLPDGIDFVSDPLEKGKMLTLPENGSLYFDFHDVRSICIDFLQDRRISLPQRILLLGFALRELASKNEDISSWINKSQEMLSSAETIAAVDSLEMENNENRLAMFVFNNLRVMQATMPSFIREELSQSLGVTSLSDINTQLRLNVYTEARSRYTERYADKQYFMENLIVSIFFHLRMPTLRSREELWKSYTNLCSLYSFYRFMAVMSCREGSSADTEELFRLLVYASRDLIHNSTRRVALRDELFQHDSATLAHMSILLSG